MYYKGNGLKTFFYSAFMGFLKADYAFNAAHIETWALVIYWKNKQTKKKLKQKGCL